MNITIILFGQLSDIIGHETLMMSEVLDTDQLQVQLKQHYPGLAASKFVIVVDKQLVQENTRLNEDNIVALLPPFSGG
jgi:molybdopterin synthase sulfur carrier subunit